MRTIEATETLDDVQLVELSRDGDREAFGRIVERYQSLICALTYSACGNFQASEDLAQVTFVTAWSQLRNLREPAKLKSWLCSIARNATINSFRQQGRTPTAHAEALDSSAEISSDTPSPSDHVISKEEEAILWRSLGELPPTYREPLVLFYRQQQSVAEVADALELSEDAVKQRLSRGRTMLTEKVTAFVEGTLKSTNPGETFTLGVLAALPVMATSAKAAAIGVTAATGSATAKAAAALGLFGVFFGPIVGLLAGVLGTKIGIDSAQSNRDRQFRIKAAWINWSLVLGFNVLMFGGIYFAGAYWKTHTVFLTWAVITVAFGYVIAILRLAIWSRNQSRRINREEAADPLFNATAHRCNGYEYRSLWTLFGWPLVHIRFGEASGKWQPAKGWIACGNVAYGILFAFGGVAVGGFSIGGVAVGGIALGGFTLGLFSFGGLALGLLVMGGAAIGYMAWGGAAIAWLAALGGAAVGHRFALGGVAVAEHANDHAARAFVRDSVFFSHASLLMTLAIIVYCLSMLPGFLYFLKQSRQQRAGR